LARPEMFKEGQTSKQPSGQLLSPPSHHLNNQLFTAGVRILAQRRE
jgi:hypothetical protein